MGQYGIKDGAISAIEDDEAEFEFSSPNSFFGSNVNLIPMQNAVQGPRLFYGARFFNQALPLAKPEAPLVQSAVDNDPDGASFDDRYGRRAGARFADEDGTILSVKDSKITYRNAAGEKKDIELYHNFPFNRKTALHQRSVVQPGTKITKGQILAASNYTDDKGTLALGTNARVGVVPYQGFSMDDAIVVSESFRHRLASQHSYMTEQEFDQDVKGGKSHFHALFPTTFKKDQLELLDDEGVIREGMKVNPGDPLVLATKPRVISSSSAQLGRLSRAMQQTRGDASKTWTGEHAGVVTDVARTRNGVKVVVASTVPGQKGDKIVFRSGQKGVISKIIPDDHMPRTMDGQPLEVLLNPLGIPSRANDSILYELLLGKIAAKGGKAYKLPTFNKKDENWYDFVEQQLKEAGVDPKDEVFDPLLNKKLENPITTGVGHILKLHHTSESKASSRGQGGYSSEELPLKGGGDGAGAKRLSGLEVHGLLSAGAYATLREGATLRGQRNDEYWRAIRQGHKPKEPGKPFVWDKFKALLLGAGLEAKDVGDGNLRLGPFTDRSLGARNPIEVKNGEIVNLKTQQLREGGLFDKQLTGTNQWGQITLDEAIPNPAFEDSIRRILGLKRKDLMAILDGTMDLPEHLR